MSLSKKSFLTGVLLAIVVGMSSSAFALEGARFFRPWQPEDFGGKHGGRDGLYGAVEAISWTIEAPGHSETYGNPMTHGTSFDIGTRVTLGNRRGNHGWRVSGFSLRNDRGATAYSPVQYWWSEVGETAFRMAVDDPWTEANEGDYNARVGQPGWTEIIPGEPPVVIEHPETEVPVWEEFQVFRDRAAFQASIDSFSSHTDVFDIDLNWTYRTSPLSWGSLEFFAGAKYRSFEEDFALSHVTSTYNYVFYYDPIGTGGYNIGDEMPNGTIVEPGTNGQGTWLLDPTHAPNIAEIGGASQSNSMSEIYEYWTTVRTDIKSEVKNRMFGPNLGFEVSRQNARWTFSAAPSLFLGFNSQSAHYYRDSYSSPLEYVPIPALVDPGMLVLPTVEDLISVRQMMMVNNVPTTSLEGPTVISPTPVNRHNHRNVFSPGISLNLAASWQWTDAIAIRGGFDTTYMTHVLRGTDISVGSEDQVLQFLRKGDDVLMYGFSLGLEVKR